MVNAQLDISVIIPSYQSAYLNQTLDSLRDLTGVREILVVDSSPNPPSLNGETATLIHTHPRLNPGAARNLGARKASGEWLFFLDSDVALNPESEGAIKMILKDPSAQMCSGIYDHQQSQDNFFSQIQDRILLYRIQNKAPDGSHLFSSSHFLIRKSIFDQIGGFNESLRTYEDMEFVARARKLGYQQRLCPDLKGIHLKRYSFFSGLLDYGRKTFNAAIARQQYPVIFKGYPAYLGQLGFSWLICASLPVLGLALFLGSGSGILAVAATALVWLTTFPLLVRILGAQGPLCLAGWLLWPLLSSIIAGSALTARMVWMAQRLRSWVVSLLDFARTGWRIVFRSGMPVQIILYVTSRCNLRCEHCFYKETLDAPDPGELPLQVFDKTTRSIGPVLWFSLGGGEPFLRKDLVELIGLIQRNCRPKVFSFPTNGWYTEKIFETCIRALETMKDGNLILFFSLDGTQEMHDAIRGKGSYERVQKTFRRLKPLQEFYPNFYLNLVTTVTDRNADAATGAVDEFIRDFQPNAISINLFRYHSLKHPPLSNRLIEGYRAATEHYKKRLKENALKHYGFLGGRILFFKEILQKDLIYRVAKYDEFVTPCTAGTLSYVIMENGQIKPCEILADTLGNIKGDAEFATMIRTKEAKNLRRWIRDTNCRCTYECAMSTNTLFSWPMSKQLIRGICKDMVAPEKVNP
ncbi:MAG: glycosyltransferase [Elusimicrobia bacterium]|nr:glycosyltransferase [Elusimicrobiota bacterium]